MPRHERPNPDTDPFRPPAIPTEVCCLHCGQEYESYLIQWREEADERGQVHGFWCCPTPGCDGKGFGFDIFPTDPEYRGEDGEPLWSIDDCEEDPALDDLDNEDDLEDGLALDLDGELFEADPPTSPHDSFGPVDLDHSDDRASRPRRWFDEDDDEDIPF